MMTRYTRMKGAVSALAFVVTGALVPSAALAVEEDWGFILSGDYLSFGFNTIGTLGNGGEGGSGIMYDRTGTGTFDPEFDFLSPGAPFDGFGINSGATLLLHNNNDFLGEDPNVEGTLTNYSGVEHEGETWDNRVVWTTETADMVVSHDYFFNNDDQQLRVRTSITARNTLDDLYFVRGVDPDAVVAEGDSSTTRNTLVDENPFVTAVYGETLVSLYLMGLLAPNDQEGVDGVVARNLVMWGNATNWPTNGSGAATPVEERPSWMPMEHWGLDANRAYNDCTITSEENDYWFGDPERIGTTCFGESGVESDDVIGLAFDLGSLVAGDTRSFLYSYIFGNDLCAFGACVTAEGTTVTLERTVALNQAQLARLAGSLTRLAHQELQVQVPVNLSAITVSTQGELEAGPRFAVRVGGTHSENTETGEATAGSLTAAFAVSDTLTFGASMERAEFDTSIGSFTSIGDANSFAVYLRDRNVTGEGMTWRASFGYASGSADITRASGFFSAEGGTGTADLNSTYAALDLGYGVRHGSFMLTPSVRLARTSTTRGAYTETDAVGYPLSFDEYTETSTTFTFGTDVSFDVGPRSAMTIGMGFEHDLSRSSAAMTGTSSIEDLETFAIDATDTMNSTRAFATMNFRHAFNDSSSILATVRAGQDAYSDRITATVGLNYEYRF